MGIRKIKQFLEDIEKFNSYFHVHGGDVLITILTVFLVLIIMGYLGVKKKSVEIKKKWPEKRCDPGISPFAGFLNPPPEATTIHDKLKFTMDNYALCNSQVLKKNVGFFTSPLAFVQDKLKILFSLIGAIFDDMKNVVAIIKQILYKLIEKVWEVVGGVIVHLQLFLIKLKDLLMKTGGFTMGLFLMGVASSYMTIAALNNFAFTIGLILLILLIAVIILGIISKIPLLGTWAIPPYISVLIVYLFYTILGTLVIIYVEYIKYVKSEQECKSLGGEHCCFHPNTTVKTKLGYKQMKNLEIGDELDGGNFVESLMIVNPGKPLYSYAGIFVTGEHYVYENNKFIMVKESPTAILTSVKTEYYSCIQTTKKYIIINNKKFADWDDLNEDDKNELKMRYNILDDINLNKKFNSGISSDTMLELQDGRLTTLRTIKVGDILKDGNIVFGKIKVKNPTTCTEYKFNNKKFIGYNLYLKDLGNGVEKEHNVTFEETFYHLVMSKKYIEIGCIKVGDFNWVYDTILDKHNMIFNN